MAAVATLSSSSSAAGAIRSRRVFLLLRSLSLPPLLRSGFCSEAARPDGGEAGGDEDPTTTTTTKTTTKKTSKTKTRVEDTICRMMARRPWTTRLQNSIRAVVPHFDRDVVLAVLRASRTQPDRALRFFRWVEKTGFRHDPDTCREVISLLARASMLNHARCILLDDMPAREIPRDEDMIISLIEGYGRAAIPQEAVKLFRRMPDLAVPRSSRSYDALFKAILRTGRVMMAKRLFNAMLRDGLSPTLTTYNTLLWGFCLSLKMDTAARFLADMKDRGISPDLVTYNTLLNGWVRTNRLQDADQVFAEITTAGFAPNYVSYNILIKGYASAGKIDDALRLFAEMRDKDLKPSERTYSALLPCLCSVAEKAVEAQKLLNEMAERRMAPKDPSTFLRLIACLCEAGDWDGALDVHRVANSLRVPVDTAHYGLLMENLCKGGKYESAIKVMDELLQKGTLSAPQSAVMEASAYNPMIEYLCGHGLTDKAENFFRQLMKKGVEDKAAFNHLIRGHSKEGKPQSASELLGIMSRREIETESDAYALLVEGFLKKGEPADARTALDSMVEQGHLPSSTLFRSVMTALFDDGRVQTASRVMKTMIEKGVKENMDIAYRILEALFTRGHIEEALGRINLMMMNDCVPDVDRLLVALCDKDNATAAHKLADFALERDCDVSFSSYDRVLDALSSAGMTLPAYSLLCKIKAKGQVVNKKGCEALIKSLVAEGNTKQADILSRILSEKGQVPGSKRGTKVAMHAY